MRGIILILICVSEQPGNRKPYVTRNYHVTHDQPNVSPSGVYFPDHSKKGQKDVLGFQFKNKSPRIIPPGALKDIAYAPLDGDNQNLQNIDYHDNDSFTAKFHSIDSNYQTYKTPDGVKDASVPHINNKIFATSGPALVSPNNYSMNKGSSMVNKQYFNKNAHLMQGVLSQQRRFSRIISSNTKNKPALNLSNADIKQLQQKKSVGRNSMANSLPVNQGAKNSSI